jgi:hypothetical protein
MSIEMNQNYYELINEYHKDPNGFAFFVGSGLSVPLFPTWQQLLEKMLVDNKSLFTEDSYNELLLLLKNHENFLDVAELCIKNIGESKYRDILEKIFDCDIGKDNISSSYKELFLLSPQVIITTNYDKIPEILSDGKYRFFTNKNATECSRAIADKKKIIFKLHGDISDQSSIVLKRSDYQKMIFSSESNTRQLLQNLLSTRRLIFFGFSFSDPHVNLVIEGLKNINNNIPISHYILLNEQSKLQISIYENRYGIKIIPYTPEDNTHFEITDLIKCLNKNQDQSVVIEDVISNITNKESLLEYIFKELSQIYRFNVSVMLIDDVIILSLTPIAETTIELQKEVLSILKMFKFSCDDIKYIHIKIYTGNNNTIDFDENQKNIFIAKIKYDLVYKYSNGHISTNTLWDNIEFMQSHCLSNIFQVAQKIIFPINTKIIDIQEE